MIESSNMYSRLKEKGDFMKRSKKASLLSVIVGIVLAVMPIYYIDLKEITVLLVSVFVNGIVISTFDFVKTYDSFQERYIKLILDRWKNIILLIFNSIYFSSLLVSLLLTNHFDKVSKASAVFLISCIILGTFPLALNKLLKQEIELEKERKKF